MHEYSIVQALLDTVAEQTRERGGVAVHRLRVRIGELSGVEPELLQSAYMLFRENTVCDAADLDIETVGACWRCRTCDRDLDRGAVLRCPVCGGPGRLQGGDEIILDRIEMEVS